MTYCMWLSGYRMQTWSFSCANVLQLFYRLSSFWSTVLFCIESRAVNDKWQPQAANVPNNKNVICIMEIMKNQQCLTCRCISNYVKMQHRHTVLSRCSMKYNTIYNIYFTLRKSRNTDTNLNWMENHVFRLVLWHQLE